MRRASILFALGLANACDCGGGDGLKDVAPRLTLSADSIDFGEVRVGDLKVRGLTVQNTGQLTLHITTSTLMFPTGEVVIDALPLEIAPAQKFDLLLTYSPIDVGEDRGSYEIEGDDDKGPHSIPVRGVGVLGGVSVAHDGETCGASSNSISFGAVAPGTPVHRTITVTANGTAPIQLLSAVREPGTTSEFTVMGVAEDGVTIMPGQSVTLDATYTPVDGGADSGAFVLTTNVADAGSIRIPVCGEGVAPALCAVPPVLDFGPVAQNTRASRTVRLESCGRLPVDLTAVALASDAAHMTHASFTLPSPPAAATLMPGDGVDAVIEYAPTDLASHGGYLKASSNAAGAPELYVELKGRGAQPCALAVLPQRLNFQQVDPGMMRTMNVVATNEGAASCTLSSVSITMGQTEFSVTPLAAPVTLGPGVVHTIAVTYAPPVGAMGAHTGELTIDSSGDLTTVALEGTTELADGCQLEVVPSVLNFGGVPVGNIRSMGVSVNNLSSDPCTIRGVSLAPGSDPGFNNTSSNFGLILPNRSKQLTATFIPTHAGSARGELVINTNDVDSPEFRVPLFGTTADSGVCVSPRRLPFGPALGLETLDFTITACGVNPVEVTGLDFTTPDAEFSIQSPPSLPFTLQPGAQRRVTMGYQPTDQQGDTAILTVRSNDIVEPAIPVELTGGPELVPASAGRFLYYWAIPNPIGGDVMRLPLQGNTMPTSFWGPRSGKQCTGCHYVSPDGRYVALIEFSSGVAFKIIDTTMSVALTLPSDLTRAGVSYISWNPDVNTQPPYQIAFDGVSSVNGQQSSIHIGSIFAGYMREVPGTAEASASAKMPTWSRNGVITYVRGTQSTQTQGGAGGFNGPTDLMTVPVAGGSPTPVPGASNNGFANYYPAYSPDGHWLAFTQSRSAMSTIAATDATIKLAPGASSGPILDLSTANSAQGASSYPTWSVDSRFVSFSSNRPGGAGDWDIYVAPIDPMTGADGAAQPMTPANTSGFEHSAQWSP